MPPREKGKAPSGAESGGGRKKRTPRQQYEVERRIMTDASNAMCEVRTKLLEWIVECGDTPDEIILQGLVRAYEGWWGFIVDTGQERMYRYAANSLGEILGGMGMAPARRGGEGGTGVEVGTQTEVPAVNSVGSQVGLGKESVRTTETQTEVRYSVAAASQTDASEEKKRDDTPESGYESARSESGGEGTVQSGGGGSSVRTYAEAASRTARHRAKPEWREVPGVAHGGSKRGKMPAAQAKRWKAQSVVIHGMPTHRKIGKVWGWLQEDNPGVVVTGVRWLVREELRPGKLESSVVVHLNSYKELEGSGKEAWLRLGRKWHPTEKYDWNRKSYARGWGQRDQGVEVEDEYKQVRKCGGGWGCANGYRKPTGEWVCKEDRSEQE